MIDPDEINRAGAKRVRETINEPNEDLTEFGERLIELAKADHRWGEEMRIYIFLDDMEEGRGGAAFGDVESDEEMLRNLLRHMRAVFGNYGMDVEVRER